MAALLSICSKEERFKLCHDERWDSPPTSTTEDNEQVIEGIVVEGMASIQCGFHSFHKQTVLHLPPSLLGADGQWSCYVEQSATPHQRRGETSDTLYKSASDYPSFSVAVAKPWKKKL
ncbi:hypothetical protein TNCV_97741 [Trichonephila clavipes]|nr:hypothetical protein TNCV_97741 [Trichonephila clavipes]